MNSVAPGARSHLYTERGDYQDFHLRFEAWINETGNSGVCFRCGDAPEVDPVGLAGPPAKPSPRSLWHPIGYEADINPGMEPLQATTRAIVKAIKDPAERQRVDQVIKTKAIPDFNKAAPTLGDGTVRNGWVVPSTIGVYGSNWLLRTLVNDGGIWANSYEEVIYYKAFVGPDGAPLSGDNSYTLHFTKEQLPAQYATHFWSIIAVDAAHRRVLPNPKKRYSRSRRRCPMNP